MRTNPDSSLQWLAHFIARNKAIFFVLIALIYLVAFNGQWRIGLDSANYRGLGASLAAGHGFRFGEWAGSVVYRGLPVILAGVQLVAGNAAWPAVCIVLLCGGLALVVIYKLIRLHEPAWIATCVTCGVGVNSIYLQYCHELMTDVPFILGLVCSLYGYDLLIAATDSGNRPAGRRGAGVLIVGLIIAGSMRPTFWILALALWISLCVDLIRRRHVAWGAALAFMLVLAAVLLVAVARIHARTHALTLLWQDNAESAPLPLHVQAHHALGGYENEFVSHLADDSALIVDRAKAMLYDDLPKSFFGVRMGYAGGTICLALLVATILMLARRHLPWALLILLTIIVTLLWSTQARYYTTILPFLLLGWIWGLVWLLSWLPAPWRPWLLALGLVWVTTSNFVMDLHFIREQRAVPFLAKYKQGKYIPLVHLAALIRQKVPPDQAVIGPSGSILSYLSGHHVYTERELLQQTSLRNLPRFIRNLQIGWAVFPAHAYERERRIRQLMELHILRRGPAWLGASTDFMLLAPLHVPIVVGDWTKRVQIHQHATTRPTTRPKTRHVKRRKRHPTTTAPATQAASPTFATQSNGPAPPPTALPQAGTIAQ